MGEMICMEIDAFVTYLLLVLGVTLLLGGLCGCFPQAGSLAQQSAYESGMLTHPQLFQESAFIRHYLVALLFLILDLEAALLFPWAWAAPVLGTDAFWLLLLLLGPMGIAFAYVWKKGGIAWE